MLKMKVFRSEGKSAQSEIEGEVNTWLDDNYKAKIQQFNSGSWGVHNDGFVVAFLYEEQPKSPGERT